MSDYAIETIRALETLLFGSTLETLQSRLAYDRRLGSLWRSIQDNYCDAEFDLATASRACGMSQNNLNNLLKKFTGEHTFHELLTAYRVYQSCIAAMTSNESFTQIALACGFDNPSSYCRAAKRYFKVPPSAFLPRGGNHRRYLRLEPDGRRFGGRDC